MSNIRQINVNGTTFDCEDELARGLVFNTMADAQAAVLAGTVKEGMTIFIKNDDAMEISANAISYGDTTVKHELDELNSSMNNIVKSVTFNNVTFHSDGYYQVPSKYNDKHFINACVTTGVPLAIGHRNENSDYYFYNSLYANQTKSIYAEYIE